MRRLFAAASLGALVLAAPLQGGAQVVTGSTRAVPEGIPVAGVLVMGIDSVGRTAARAISGEDGRFVLRLPHGGTWRLRAERIGLAIAERLVEVGPDSGSQADLLLPVEPIAGEGLTAVSSARCPELGGSARVAEIWSRAREILADASRGRGAPASRRMVHYRRDFLDNGVIEMDRWADTIRVSDSLPMRSAPTSGLLQHGFIRVDGDTADYFAPDAHVLLSDEFLLHHCFAAATVDGRESLTFEPIVSATTYDIAGRILLPSAADERLQVDFEFTRHPWPLPAFRSGGTVAMIQGASSWIVSRWWICIPIPGPIPRADVDDPATGYRLAGLREWGVEPLDAAGPTTLDDPIGQNCRQSTR